jgi:hypothetical protein
MTLTPEILAAAFDYLRTTKPFSSWNLPDSEDVEFKVSRGQAEFGHYRWNGHKHTITASTAAIGHTDTLMRLMSHEMIHMHLEATGLESRRGGSNVHNAPFRKFAAQVCKCHGFDPKAFY